MFPLHQPQLDTMAVQPHICHSIYRN